MADQTVNQSTLAPHEIIDRLQSKLGQLTALLNVAYGAGGESFRGYSDEIQDNYLWTCAHMAEECEQLTVDLFPSVWPASVKPEKSESATA